MPGIDRANAAALLSRGLTRFFAAHGLVSLPEFLLRPGRRADLLCFDAKCRITLVEIKSSVEDFRCYQEWPQYLEYCYRFYYAVPERFPQALRPPAPGLMVADDRGQSVVPGSADSAFTRAGLTFVFPP